MHIRKKSEADFQKLPKLSKLAIVYPRNITDIIHVPQWDHDGMCTTSLTNKDDVLVAGLKASLTAAHPVESDRSFLVFWSVGALEYWLCMPCVIYVRTVV